MQALPTHWRMRAGEHIPISAMSDSHLTNTILMLNRRLPVLAQRIGEAHFISLLVAMAATPRHSIMDNWEIEMAEQAIENFLRDYPQPYPIRKLKQSWPIYLALSAEAERRSDLAEWEAAMRQQQETEDYNK